MKINTVSMPDAADVKTSGADNREIFVSIASYRDRQLVPTIESAISNAAKPDKLHFAVCYQDEVQNPDYARLKAFPNLKVIAVPPYESKGCCRARALTQMLYDGEEYFLQIDSHMRFAENWDDELIRMLKKCPSPKPLFSMYCNDFSEYELYLQTLTNPEINEKPAYVQGAREMVPFRLMDFGQASPVAAQEPHRAAFISGHFIFAGAEFMKEIPADSELYFEGEETSLSVRAWTHGWDVYVPYRNLVFHKYEVGTEEKNTTKRITHWEEHNQGLFDYLSKIKVKNITLGLEKGKYGIGDRRTIEELEQFTGINFKNMTVSSKTQNGEFC